MSAPLPPDWFPAKIDWRSQSVLFRKINPGAFYAVPFHDGRHDFLEDIVRPVSFGALVSADQKSGAEHEDRFILHHAFCGSTFLAQLLSRAGQSVCYREPQVLIELSQGPNIQWPEGLATAILARFRQAPGGEYAAFVKPSNWVNPALIHSGALQNARVVLIDMDLRAFLIANIRGGTPRISYSVNLLNHALHFHPEWQRAARGAQNLLATSGMAATLRLLSILHIVQCEQFDNVMQSDAHAKRVSHMDIRTAPVRSAALASDWLGLGLTQKDITGRYEALGGLHAKSILPDPFSVQKEQKKNNEILRQFGDDIARAEDWALGQQDAWQSQ